MNILEMRKKSELEFEKKVDRKNSLFGRALRALRGSFSGLIAPRALACSLLSLSFGGILFLIVLSDAAFASRLESAARAAQSSVLCECADYFGDALPSLSLSGDWKERGGKTRSSVARFAGYTRVFPLSQERRRQSDLACYFLMQQTIPRSPPGKMFVVTGLSESQDNKFSAAAKSLENKTTSAGYTSRQTYFPEEAANALIEKRRT